MAGAMEIFLFFNLILTTIWAGEDGPVDQLTARQDELLNANPANPWMFPYYYNIQPQVPFAGYAYTDGIPFYRKPSSGYFAKREIFYFLVDVSNDGHRQEDRLGFGNLGANLFGNLFTPPTRPFRPLANLFVNRMDACSSSSGDAGICTSAFACSLFSRKPSGSCNLGRVCCVEIVSSCGSTVTLNNTYWQSPSTPVSAPSTCALTVRLDTKLVEQLAKPICQIRLDFVSFMTAQPTAGTCTDTFEISGSTTTAPTICGVNSGQHMYLDIPSSATTPTDVRLSFNFGTATAITRSWKIKIAMLPCSATYLAPADCLQYFTADSGRVKSFNWQDVAGTTTRQLNNQNYDICFRTELVPSQKATQMCLSICSVSNGGDAFSITTPTSSTDAAAAVVTATTNLVKAQTTLTNAKTTLATAQTTLANAQTALTTAQNNIAPTQAALTAAKDALIPAQEAATIAEMALTDAQGAHTETQTLLTSAKESLEGKEEVLATAKEDLTKAEAAIPPDETAITDARAAATAAQTAVDEAQTAVADAETAEAKAQSDVDKALAVSDNAQTAVDKAQLAVDKAQLAADNAKTAVTDAETAVNNAKTGVNNAPAAVTDAQTAVTSAQAALTAAQIAAANAVASAAALSGVGTSAIVNGVNTATCLYDFLLIAGARDSTNVKADRYCGNALNPATTPVATSVPVCTPIKPFRMTFQTDNTEEAVTAGANILPAPADTANTGFCLDYQEK
ncbi:hypothetical protein DAPPUDRAFT_110154 [Daphnia pulex]|uniref:CUB domain-containing protein n=1 Tax=Daphnia pulex TaxID=6669 RepID=E9H5N3_DAPPU|nr:hypothetical protein DAPPUDRAFT_110154 [Daphnia pulex]|eukprot:EFX72899.1 hypothetical protein DAPPUDRAFT_110154 [Daphnia pulex]